MSAREQSMTMSKTHLLRKCPRTGLLLVGSVVAVSASPDHSFSKLRQNTIRMVKGHGIEGDAHAGRYVRHRYLAKKQPRLPNLRQVHLMPIELFEEVRTAGFDVNAGDLGENVTTAGLEITSFPLGTLLQLGKTAVIELTGLRTPCSLIDRFRKGLKKQMLGGPETAKFKCGVLGIVLVGGQVFPNDVIKVVLPPEPCSILPAL